MTCSQPRQRRSALRGCTFDVGWERSRGSGASGRDRKADDELRAGPRRLCEVQRSPVRLHDAARDREPNPAAGARRLGGEERIKKAAAERLRHARAVVGHRDLKGLAGATDLDRDSPGRRLALQRLLDRKSTRLNSSHSSISYAVFCLKKKNEYAG